MPRSMVVERVTGLLSACLGIGGVAFATFAPLTSHESCAVAADGSTDCTTWTSNLWEDERGVAVALMLIVTAPSLIVAIGVMADTRGDARLRWVVLAGSVLLAGSALALVASVGLFIAPAALAAVAASAAACLRSEPERRGALR